MNQACRLICAAALVGAAWGQQTPAAKSSPPMRINILNVCQPEPDAVAELRESLMSAPLEPSFAIDFETARGRSLSNGREILGEGGQATAGVVTDWVRLRREFREDAPFLDAQYTLERAVGQFSETLVLHVRPPKSGDGKAMQLILNDVFAASSPNAPLPSPAPTRLRLERFGKSSVVLARCGGVDQKQYEPLFTRAAQLMQAYRRSLRTRSAAMSELRRLAAEAQPAEKRKSKKEVGASPAANNASKH